jgi:hypothetical protein
MIAWRAAARAAKQRHSSRSGNRTRVNELSEIKDKSKNGWKRNKTRYERKRKERRKVMKRKKKNK